jgi:hypothetical protein
MKRKRTTITPAMEQRVVEMLKLGMHKSSIIKEVGISTTSVGRVIKRNASSIPPELLAKLIHVSKLHKPVGSILITISRTMNGKVHIAPDGIYINY